MLDSLPVNLTLNKDILNCNSSPDIIINTYTFGHCVFEEDISSRNSEEFNAIWKAFHCAVFYCSVN